jgi:hypothetical protein
MSTTRREPSRRWVSVRPLLVLAALILVPGCEPVFGPPRARVVSFTGRVLWHGQPIPRGWLEISPTDGTIGHLRSTRLAPDGTFRAERVPVGTVAIRIVGMPRLRSRDPVEDRFLLNIRQVSLIRRTVPPDGLQGCLIELERETLLMPDAAMWVN